MKLRGVTLVEIMVAVLLSTVVLGAGYKIWTSTRRDFSTASTRQTLQHEVRMAIEMMSADLKAARKGSFKASKIQNQDVITFERFKEEKMEEGKLDSQQTYEVAYVWDPSTMTLMRKAKGSTKYLSTHIALAQIEQTENTQAANNSTDPNVLGSKARIDITLSGMKRIPVTGLIASHTEKVSVFMRDEFYSAVNKNRYISMADLTSQKTDDIKKDEENPLLTLGAISKEQLKNMTTPELRDTLGKEQACLNEMKNQADEVQKQIEGLDTQGDRHWYRLWTKADSEFTSEQRNLLNHNKSADVENDIKNIKDKITEREKKYIGISMGKEGMEPSDIEKAAFDLKIKDYNIKKAYNDSQKGKKDNEKDPPPQSVFVNLDPATMQQGITIDSQGNRVEFSETPEAFKERKAYAEKIMSAANKIDIDKLQSTVGDEGMRTYASGKDLLDLANSKYSTLMRKEQHEANIKLIKDEISSRGG